MPWDWDGTLERIHHALYVAAREQAGHEASPTAAIIGQPNQQSCSKRGSALDPQGFDAGKKVTGRKRHTLVDTLGLLLNVVAHSADVQDRDGARQLLRTARRRFPFIDLPMQAIKGPGWPRWSPTLAAGPCRSSNALTLIASLSCQRDGSLNEPSPGSAVIEGSDATLNVTPHPSPLSCLSR